MTGEIILLFTTFNQQNVGQFVSPLQSMAHSLVVAPTLAEIRLKMAETEVQQGNLSGSVSTLTEGLAIEKSQ
jgi:hypothetical protein